MADSAAELKFETQKRRSERVAQSVPVIVSGVDALGRPFREQTTTAILSCHGCRYNSKHYVLKNMWVTLEVPQPDQRQPRFARAQVKWVQRPRTVRELFHVAVELERPGNIWGLSAEPASWSLFPESPETAAQGESELTDANLPKDVPCKPESSLPSNIRLLPVGGSKDKEMSQMLLEQMAVLVQEGRQQLEDSLSQMLSKAAEYPPGLPSGWEQKIEQAAQRALQEIAPAAAKRAVQENLSSIQEELSRADERIRASLGELQRRAALILEAQSRELADRTGRAVSEAMPKIQTSINTAAEEAVSRINMALQESLQEIERRRREMANDSEHAVQTVRGRLQETMDRLSREFHTHLGERARTAADSLSNAARAYEADLEIRSGVCFKQALVKAEADLHEKSGAILAAFGQELQRQTHDQIERAREQFNDETLAAMARAKSEFEKALALDRERVSAEARRELSLASQFVFREFSAECERRQSQTNEAAQSSTNDALEAFRNQLHAISEAWLLTSGTRLNQHSERLIELIAREAETKLAHACSRALADFSTHLRQRTPGAFKPEKFKSATAQ